PRSSKATDIIKNTGITAVKRIERAILFGVEGQVSASELKQIQDIVHDRMVEDVFSCKDDLYRLFSVTAPKELEFVNVLEKGAQAI
ncbi:hypothetical protein NAI74_09505, partial [Francisella tularensis subsp. holarctica]|uniref:hypothetical protein n=1 Tax=Francisella tularensis TaxID=263 RepID=UPI002381CC27